MSKLENQKLIGWIVCLSGCAFYLAMYFVRVSPGVMGDILFKEFNASASALGLLSGYFYYSYIFMQIPVGILVDKFGVRKLLSAATLIFAVSCFMFGKMSTMEVGYIARFIMGFAAAFAFVGTLKLVTLYLPKQFAVIGGLAQGLGMAGAVIGNAPLVYIFEAIGWRTAFFVFGCGFIVLSIIMFTLIRDKPTLTLVSKDDNKSWSSIWKGIVTVYKNPQIYVNCLYVGLIYAPIEVFGEQWGSMFASINGDLPLEKAAFQISFIFIGMAIGCPLMGWISDKVQSRVKVMRYTALACTVIMSAILYSKRIDVNFGYLGMIVLMFLYGICSAGLIPAFAVSTETSPQKVSGLAISITNMSGALIGAIIIPVIGHFIDLMASTHAVADAVGMSRYNLGDLQIAFMVLPLCNLGCVIATFFIKETFGTQRK